MSRGRGLLRDSALAAKAAAAGRGAGLKHPIESLTSDIVMATPEMLDTSHPHTDGVHRPKPPFREMHAGDCVERVPHHEPVKPQPVYRCGTCLREFPSSVEAYVHAQMATCVRGGAL